jgi:hypothetical protein
MVVVGLIGVVILATSLTLLIGQQYAKAIWIRANLGPSTLTSYSPGGKYYELKDIKIVDSKTCKCPITLTDPLVSSPVISITSDSVSLSGTLNAHTSPIDTNLSHISLSIPIIHIKNETSTLTMDLNGSGSVGDNYEQGIGGQVIINKAAGTGTLDIGGNTEPKAG